MREQRPQGNELRSEAEGKQGIQIVPATPWKSLAEKPKKTWGQGGGGGSGRLPDSASVEGPGTGEGGPECDGAGGLSSQVHSLSGLGRAAVCSDQQLRVHQGFWQCRIRDGATSCGAADRPLF